MTSTPTTARDLGYDDLGTGGPALLLLPGWCGDRTMYRSVLTPLSANRRTVAVDLRGQGGFADETADFDSATQLDDLVTLVDTLGLDEVVPVAAAHAGWFAIELRRRLGAARVPGIVLVDWMVLGTPPGFTEALAGLTDEHAWTGVRSALFEMWTSGVHARAVHEYVASMGGYGFAHWSRAGREIAAAFAREGAPVDALARLEDPCPTRHVYAQPADDGFLSAQQAFAAAHPWFSVTRLQACSHFPMLEVPGALADQVESFVGAL